MGRIRQMGRIGWIGALITMVIGAGIVTAVAGGHPRWAGGALQIRGYDTTAYFRAQKAQAGRAQNEVTWQGGTWRFGSAAEAQLFQANPGSYTPRFGAYCTGGLSQQHVVNGHPENWRIHNGKLYLFYAAAGARRFDKDPDGTIRAARAYAKIVGIEEN